MPEQPTHQLVTVTTPDGTVVSEELFDHELSNEDIAALGVATYLSTAGVDFTVDELLSGDFAFLADIDDED